MIFWVGFFAGLVFMPVLIVGLAIIWRIADATLYAAGYIWASNKVAKLRSERFQHHWLLCLFGTWWERFWYESFQDTWIDFGDGYEWIPYFTFKDKKKR